MDLSTLQARCAFRYRDTTNRFVEADNWTDYLNEAYRDVASAEPYWPFLESQDTSLSVAAGTGTVTLPADAWKVSAVYNDTDSVPLVPIPGRSQYRQWFRDPSNSLGTPQFYRLRGNILEVYPWPASATTIHVDIATPPADLALGTDEPVFPEHYHHILVMGALAKAYEDDGDPRWASSYQARYERLLADMRRDLLDTRTESYPEVIDTF